MGLKEKIENDKIRHYKHEISNIQRTNKKT